MEKKHGAQLPRGSGCRALVSILVCILVTAKDACWFGTCRFQACQFGTVAQSKTWASSDCLLCKQQNQQSTFRHLHLHHEWLGTLQARAAGHRT